jgi:hypothetical protein
MSRIVFPAGKDAFGATVVTNEQEGSGGVAPSYKIFCTIGA